MGTVWYHPLNPLQTQPKARVLRVIINLPSLKLAFKFADIVNTVGAECAAAAAARNAKAIAQLHKVAAQLGFSRGWDLQGPDADRWDDIDDPRPLGFSRACSRRSRGGRVARGAFDYDDDENDEDDDDDDDLRRYI